MYKDELYHYGVLGMKWGQRKVRKNIEKSKKARANHDEDLAKKYETKAKNIQRKHERRAGGKDAYNYTAKQSTGKAIAKSMVFGTYGTVRYNELRSKNYDRGQAAIAGVLYNLGNLATNNLMSIVEPRLRK